jgi:hypothetical protein
MSDVFMAAVFRLRQQVEAADNAQLDKLQGNLPAEKRVEQVRDKLAKEPQQHRIRAVYLSLPARPDGQRRGIVAGGDASIPQYHFDAPVV